MCHKREVLDLVGRQAERLSSMRIYRLLADESSEGPLTFVTVNFICWRGRSLIERVLRDADLKRNQGASCHITTVAEQLLANRRRRIVMSTNRQVKSVVRTLTSFFADLQREGLQYRHVFGVCTALESCLDWRCQSFRGGFVTTDAQGRPIPGEVERTLRRNQAAFVKHLNQQGLNSHLLPELVYSWDQVGELEEFRRQLLTDLFNQVATHCGPNIVFLDVQDIFLEKKVNRLFRRCLPDIPIIQLFPDRNCDKVCYL